MFHYYFLNDNLQHEAHYRLLPLNVANMNGHLVNSKTQYFNIFNIVQREILYVDSVYF